MPTVFQLDYHAEPVKFVIGTGSVTSSIITHDHTLDKATVWTFYTPSSKAIYTLQCLCMPDPDCEDIWMNAVDVSGNVITFNPGEARMIQVPGASQYRLVGDKLESGSVHIRFIGSYDVCVHALP